MNPDPAFQLTSQIHPPLVPRALKQRWAQLIQKVYETDPLICTQCGGAMRIISFMAQH